MTTTDREQAMAHASLSSPSTWRFALVVDGAEIATAEKPEHLMRMRRVFGGEIVERPPPPRKGGFDRRRMARG